MGSPIRSTKVLQRERFMTMYLLGKDGAGAVLNGLFNLL